MVITLLRSLLAHAELGRAKAASLVYGQGLFVFSLSHFLTLSLLLRQYVSIILLQEMGQQS